MKLGFVNLKILFSLTTPNLTSFGGQICKSRCTVKFKKERL
ncbi:hypothetical protein CAMRE0001_0147 [Campylobacter rectus RM3267]|uniref:Uncharacterized protein n=1 Tax=Campylobacter rectus RM3267 TaxID=553218 RepID=B9CXV7_CAMRE|nr:hypothetical protein CAMRE0001_0147 [Campylobacter rectus RM3267]